MNVTHQQPKLIYLDIICILLAGVLIFSFFEPVITDEKIETSDWLLYDRYVEIMDTNGSNNQETDYELSLATDKYYNVADSSDETLVLVNKAKTQIRTKLGRYTSLLWERFNSIQVKDCDLNSDIDVFACYSPEDNTIYRNRLVADDPSLNDYRLSMLAHELIHALLECDRTAFVSGTGTFHEGFTEYLAQIVYPTDSPTYYLSYCIAEIFVKDNGLDRAIDLFMSGQAEKSINQRVHKENLIQNINDPLYMTAAYPSQYQIMELIVLDVYIHYAIITGINSKEHVSQAFNRLEVNEMNLATIRYLQGLRQQLTSTATITVAVFFCKQKIHQPIWLVYFYSIIKRSF